MTTEEKAKAYDEALEKAKKYMDEGYTVLMPDLFPQLRESEDEQTRRRLIDFISNIKAISESGRNSWAIRKEDAEMCNAFLLYLEKQKEQKSIGTDFRTAVKNLMNLHKIKNKFTEEDYDFHTKELLELVEQKPVEIDEYEIIKKHITEDLLSSDVNKRLKECGWYVTEEKPTEWSEEDEDIRDTIIHDLKRLGGDIANVKPAYKKEIDWLKSIRPKHPWKPSEEQIESVRYFVNKHQSEAWAATGQWKQFTALRGLLGDLLKLM